MTKTNEEAVRAVLANGLVDLAEVAAGQLGDGGIGGAVLRGAAALLEDAATDTAVAAVLPLLAAKDAEVERLTAAVTEAGDDSVERVALINLREDAKQQAAANATTATKLRAEVERLAAERDSARQDARELAAAVTRAFRCKSLRDLHEQIAWTLAADIEADAPAPEPGCGCRCHNDGGACEGDRCCASSPYAAPGGVRCENHGATDCPSCASEVRHVMREAVTGAEPSLVERVMRDCDKDVAQCHGDAARELIRATLEAVAERFEAIEKSGEYSGVIVWLREEADRGAR